MKVSALIERLQALKNLHGDLPVTYQSPSGEVTVDSVHAYDSAGNPPGPGNDAVEAHIH
jgi:hypothetical protein